jgi:hypothetical protein
MARAQAAGQILPQALGTGDSPTFEGLTLSGLTQGSVLFAGAGGEVTEDTNLYYDTSNVRLGIANPSPVARLDVRGGDAALSNGKALYSFGTGFYGDANAKWATFWNITTATRFLTAAKGSHANAVPNMHFSSYNGSVFKDFIYIDVSSSNIGLFEETTFGPSAKNTMSWPIGTAPDSSTSNAAQIWVQDRQGEAGTCGLAMRTEDGATHILGKQVGLGTLAPGAYLDIKGASGVNFLRLTTDSGTICGMNVAGLNDGLMTIGGNTGLDGIVLGIDVLGGGSTDIFTLYDGGSLQVGGAFQTSRTNYGSQAMHFVNGTAPTAGPANASAIYAADVSGNSVIHARTENGDVLKLYQQAAITDADGTLADITTKFNTWLSYARNNGLIST